ncbi:MAG: hypothetical protein WAK66_01980 [Methylocystis sp.]
MSKTREAFGQDAAPDKIARPRAATRTLPGDHQRDSGQTAAARAPLSRPPCVTWGQLVRVAILVLGAAAYADRANLTTDSHFRGDQSEAAVDVDGVSTASIGPAARTEPGSGR